MNKKRIYTVATSHLDTIWSWDFESTVSIYIYNTIVDNIAMLKKYPTYTFSFEGSYRYELMEEYYPELFEEMKEYIKQGRWNVTGSAFENGDTNCPSPEALFRNILIGNSYFYEKFGKRSNDIYLPDCFGFGWALPSIAYHSNLKGFTTQKLAWGSAYGTPFDIGKWYGVDGNFIYASCNPHDYYFTLKKLRDWDFVQKKLEENEKFGLDWTYIFHGIGDRGGAPEEETVKLVDDEIKKNSSSDIEVLSTSADQIYRDIENELPDEVKDKLPKWENELVMQNHGVGGYTSRTIGKRWNAKCQELADMAERAGVIADYYGTANYNEDVLEKSWKRAIAHQFHDDTPGTSVQRAYRRSWNDYAMSINQFNGEFDSYLSSVSQLMKSDFCTGIPVMVTNTVEAERTSLASFVIKNATTDYVRVYDEKGREAKSQVNKRGDDLEVLFIAQLNAMGSRVYDVRMSKEPCPVKSSLNIDANIMSNQKYDVRLNMNGDISSIIDKEDNDRELLSAPIILGMFNYTGSKDWPAWEMNYKEANKEPDRIPVVESIKILENGPARVTFEVKQRDKKSLFTNYISLTDSSNTVDVYSEIEWQSLRTMCKNRFAFTAYNEKATFDLGLGAIERGNMSEKLFEVPAQKWADITDKSGEFGVSVFSECKHGWDKYNDNTLRLTAIHTPKRNYRIDSMQSMMDLGLNRYSYSIYSHKGTVGDSTQLESKLFTYPLAVTIIEKHQGALGTGFSFVNMSNSNIILRAMKKPHHNPNSDEIIVRFNEGAKQETKGFKFTLGEGIEAARELWGSEEFRQDAVAENGYLVCDFKPYEVKTFAIKLKKSSVNAVMLKSKAIELDYSNIQTEIPDNLLPQKITTNGIDFEIKKNAYMLCNGQTLEVDNGNKLALLVASTNGDISDSFVVNGQEVIKKVYAINEPYAKWDLYDFKEMAMIKSDACLGYEFTHSVNKQNDNITVNYADGRYFWLLILDGTTTLPNNENIVILAASQVNKNNSYLATQFIEQVPEREFTFKMSLKEKLGYLHSKCVWMLGDKDNFLTHYNNGRNKRVEQTKKNLKRNMVK